MFRHTIINVNEWSWNTRVTYRGGKPDDGAADAGLVARERARDGVKEASAYFYFYLIVGVCYVCWGWVGEQIVWR